MAHFVDKFQYKLINDKVVMSVAVNENMVTEHQIPIAEIIMMVESAKSDSNFQSRHIGIKFLRTGVLLKLKENDFSRQIYKFSKDNFRILISQLRRSVNLKVESDSQSKEEENISYEQQVANTIVATVEPIVTSMFSAFAEERTKSLNLAVSLKSQVNDLQNHIVLLQQKLADLTQKIENMPTQVLHVGDTHKSPTNQIDDDMPMYIPSSVKTEYEGKIIKTVNQSEDKTVETAMNILKQMKKKGKKK